MRNGMNPNRSPALSHIICKQFLVILSSPHHYNGFDNKNKTPAYAGAFKSHGAKTS